MSELKIKRRKIDQEGRIFQEKWEKAYFFVEVKGIPTCLICRQRVSVTKEYNLRRHYETNHGNYDKYVDKIREDKVRSMKNQLNLQQKLFFNANKTSDAAVKCSYVISEKIARASKPFTDGEFIKSCILSAVDVICPEKKQAFQSINLIGNSCRAY